MISTESSQQALLDNGGATAVACGATFSVALTASGRVVVWGGIAGCKPPPEARRCDSSLKL